MADNFGGLALPSVTTGSPVGDPLLGHLVGFLRDVINAEVAAAWNKVRPRGTAERPPVRHVFTHDPTKRDFHEGDLPALFAYRSGFKPELAAADYLTDASKISVLWVHPPTDHQAHQALREPIINSIVKAVASALDIGRHPAWTATGDSDPTAPSLPAMVDGFLLGKATQMAPVTYSGAGFDGPLAHEDMSPRRELTITSSPAAGAYNTAADIVATVLNWRDMEVAHALRFTDADGGETIGLGEDVREIVSVDLPAMLSVAGEISMGASAVQGRGSVLAQVCNLLQLATLEEAKPAEVEIKVFDGEGRPETRVKYDALLMTVAVREQLTRDPDQYAKTPWGADIDVEIDGLAVSRAKLPDNG